MNRRVQRLKDDADMVREKIKAIDRQAKESAKADSKPADSKPADAQLKADEAPKAEETPKADEAAE